MRIGLGLAAAAAVVFTGCKREEVRVYDVAKETNAPTTASSGTTPARPSTPTPTPTAEPAPRSTAGASVPWVVPQGWEERPNSSGMRLASYGVSTPDGRSIDISVVALGEQAGTELDNVNRWRSQLKLDPITESDLTKAGEPARVGTQSAAVYDLVSATPVLDGKYKARTLAAMLPAGNMTVFFKATGEADLVAAEKPRFLQWLASVKTGPEDAQDSAATAAPATPTPPPAATAPASTDGLPNWKLPAHWKTGGPRPMRLASLVIPSDSGDPGDISISTLSAAGGALLPNVNRWRGQVQLPPTDDATLAKEALTLDLPGGAKATVVDLGGAAPNRILGAIIPKGDKVWFLKLTGPDALVKKERDNFLAWVKSVEL